MPDYFEVLGLERRFAVDLAELERRYLERSRAVHPDRASATDQGQGGAARRAGAADQAMEVNQAYRTLKRDLPRAEYLLRLEDATIADNRAVAPELLAEMLELGEELAEVVAAGDRVRLDQLDAGARVRERAELAELAARFAVLEEAPAGAPERAARLAAVVDQVIRLRYLARYREGFDRNADAGLDGDATA